MQAVLDALASFDAAPPNTVSPQEARSGPTPADAVKKVLRDLGRSTEPEPVADVRDLTIPGPAGEIQARLYAPEGAGPFPVLVYFHGGGWVIATIDTYDSSARALANAAECVVISCHYRQAPEHPYPAAHEDAVAATRWISDHAAELGGDPDRLAIAGESAGGNLATTTCLEFLKQGWPVPLHQLLVYPVVDADFDTPSYVRHAAAKPLGRDLMQWFWDNYAPDATLRSEPHATPLHADLRGLPPATVITAEIDPLCSEGEMYADRLRSAGVEVAAQRFDGVAHEFFGMGAVVDKARDAVDVGAAGLRRAFSEAAAKG
ncbi:MAG TPA: alpha/beta hydrolase [Candidatus Limnocylindria bacterium]|nr:alpha/beta hydrolase [Candidatus Limnocylindria bacterium]